MEDLGIGSRAHGLNYFYLGLMTWSQSPAVISQASSHKPTTMLTWSERLLYLVQRFRPGLFWVHPGIPSVQLLTSQNQTTQNHGHVPIAVSLGFKEGRRLILLVLIWCT